jgi:hypothetical protein
MAWAAISASGKRKITFISGKLNSDRYIKILEDNLFSMKAIEDCEFM